PDPISCTSFMGRAFGAQKKKAILFEALRYLLIKKTRIAPHLCRAPASSGNEFLRPKSPDCSWNRRKESSIISADTSLIYYAG
ncbi:MAG: hypothetical protein ACLFUS_17875, partial [Candidatus Sumerlaeia bacterium]